MGGAGFEPAKALPSDLQSDPFDRSGNPPKSSDHSVCFTHPMQPPRASVVPGLQENRRSCSHHRQASGGTRTHNLLITNQLLCRLSYASKSAGPTNQKVYTSGRRLCNPEREQAATKSCPFCRNSVTKHPAGPATTGDGCGNAHRTTRRRGGSSGPAGCTRPFHMGIGSPVFTTSPRTLRVLVPRSSVQQLGATM